MKKLLVILGSFVGLFVTNLSFANESKSSSIEKKFQVTLNAQQIRFLFESGVLKPSDKIMVYSGELADLISEIQSISGVKVEEVPVEQMALSTQEGWSKSK